MFTSVKYVSKHVDRRIGGLEIASQKPSAIHQVDRRIGGLEKGMLSIIASSNVDRRIGGLEML